VEERGAVFYEMETTRAVRTPRWKYVHRPEGPYELYDLEADPGEQVNLYGQPGREAIRDEQKRALDDFFVNHSDPRYDLYRGGGSKTHLLTRPGAGGRR